MTHRCPTRVDQKLPRGALRIGLKDALRAAITAAICVSTPALWAGSCEVTAGALAFGPYQPLTFQSKLMSLDKDSTADITVDCIAIDQGGAYSISLGEINGSIANRTLRIQKPGSPAMNFNIFINPDRTVIWGDGTTGAVLSGSIPANNSTQSHTVFGRIPQGQHSLHVGEDYTGQGTVTITYNP
ncbi:Csu type fimbrial protein [Hydrogenophaga sp. BPS33]|jgi:spore coat protein U-like protein|uniref:Csu type fimbrial protein n=1 Tax=Hydrogenophaga sp. BPS33 TaxID=2651974 RepID=UPI00132030A6|nr:spore coat U domain-containing protein [Hydrogenophaga sp. BPS33]QHE87186.1 spore coat protein U domain-containing protein [Hydrogenophaga sp. BPS33]